MTKKSDPPPHPQRQPRCSPPFPAAHSSPPRPSASSADKKQFSRPCRSSADRSPCSSVPSADKKQFSVFLRALRGQVLRVPPRPAVPPALAPLRVSSRIRRQFSAPLRVSSRIKRQFSAPLRVLRGSINPFPAATIHYPLTTARSPFSASLRALRGQKGVPPYPSPAVPPHPVTYFAYGKNICAILDVWGLPVGIPSQPLRRTTTRQPPARFAGPLT